ncbi:PDR/VanB family oxidoreductase [Paraburkholderia xenovorans]|jgi:ferredoxin-NADP reductase
MSCLDEGFVNMQDGTLNLVVDQVVPLTSSIRAFCLRDADGRTLPTYAAGAHLRVQVEIDGKPDWRHYSLVNSRPGMQATGAPTEYWIAVNLEEAGRGGSRWMHETVRQGHRVICSAPINQFALVCSSEEPILIAGGIGVTPMVTMAAALTEMQRHYTFHYSGRTLDSLAFVSELRSLAGNQLTLYADDISGRRLDLRELIASSRKDQPIYVCGPRGMIESVLSLGLEYGWSRDDIHFELFSGAETEVDDCSFEVELRQSGRVLAVPVGKTILDVMIDEGLDPLYDCKRGECGVCQMSVIEGEIDHRDYYLSAAERQNGNVMQICISRAKCARLVLDA